MSKQVKISTANIKRYLTGMVKVREIFNMQVKKFQYISLEDLILAKGREMYNPIFTREGKMKMCFMNAYHLMEEKDYTYCEGYAMGDIPVLHAWCIDEKGDVVDPTWEDGKEYYGIPFKTQYVRSTALKRGYYGIIDNWQEHWPLLEKFNDKVVENGK